MSGPPRFLFSAEIAAVLLCCFGSLLCCTSALFWCFRCWAVVLLWVGIPHAEKARPFDAERRDGVERSEGYVWVVFCARSLCANPRCWWSCKESLHFAAVVVIPCCNLFHRCFPHSRLAGFMWSVALSVVCSSCFTCRCCCFACGVWFKWVRRVEVLLGSSGNTTSRPSHTAVIVATVYGLWQAACGWIGARVRVICLCLRQPR